MSSFHLSDPGSLADRDPAVAEYLHSYDFPQPADARYGFVRLESPGNRNRVSLFGQAWVPGHATGTVLLLHGYAEHSGNYARLVRDLVQNQLAVLTLDFRGHGLSEGPIGHVDGPDVYVEDTEHLLSEIFSQVLPYRPLFIWGHSMGGLVGLQLLLRGKLPAVPAAVALSSPLLGFPELRGPQKLMAAVSPVLAKLVPTLPVPHGIPADFLSHDKDYLERRQRDPLIKRVTTPRWFESMKAAVRQVQSSAERLQEGSPTLLMLAGDERITNLGEARCFAFRAYTGQRHKVIEFPGICHELEKEPGCRGRLLAESLAWFRSAI
jgi:alpha-beta hydrolase superfamily lysophospholipase